MAGWRDKLDNLSERVSNLSALQFWGPIIGVFITFHLAVLTQSATHSGLYRQEFEEFKERAKRGPSTFDEALKIHGLCYDASHRLIRHC